MHSTIWIIVEEGVASPMIKSDVFSSVLKKYARGIRMKKAPKTDWNITKVVFPQPLKNPENENMTATRIQSMEYDFKYCSAELVVWISCVNNFVKIVP